MTHHIGSPGVQRGLVYASNSSGHRGPYVALFSSLLGFEGVCAPASGAMLRRLIAAPRLLLATFEDELPMISAALVARAVLGRPTAGIFLSPQRCFVREELKCRIKKLAFKGYKRVPGLTLFTITPFDIEPRFAEVANVGAHDPQYWDMHDGTRVVMPPPTPFSDEILAAAAGRPVVCLPGSLNAEKGFTFLAEALAATPVLAERLLIVAAGRVLPNARSAAEKFVASGGLLHDRRLEDAELESLYGIADAIWCCYEPGYDQASGIFGRAMQFGVPVIVRRGALIEVIAAGTPLPVIKVDFGDSISFADALSAPLPGRLEGPEMESHAAEIGLWRHDFIRGLKAALVLSTPLDDV